MNFSINKIYLLSLLLLFSCQQKQTELVWKKTFYQIGSQSSPRAADLNEDGVLDIVMGAGIGETDATEQGVIAIDGQTGELLWQQSATAHIVGSPTFYDINQDGTQDVIIGGRQTELKALDGKTGEIIWAYMYQYESDPILQYAKYNFYNSTLIPDQNEDDIPELLIVNGGNWEAAPHDETDRYPGVLMLINPVDGEILAADTMPDGKESYLSPIYLPFSQTTETAQLDQQTGYILFGTGGETVKGHLYLATVEDLLQSKLSKAKMIATEAQQGFIAPPSLADINEDNIPDILAISHSSTVFAIDGQTHESLWTNSFPGMESSNGLAVGQFTDDHIPDIVVTLSEGIWPNYTYNNQLVLNGKTGQLVSQQAIGCFSLSTPVVCNLDSDRYDEIILSVNEYDCTQTIEQEDSLSIKINHSLMFVDFEENRIGTIDKVEGFKNFYSTPWIGELDQDGYLDIVYPQYFHPGEINRFLGMSIKRISTNIPIRSEINWGAYMSSNGNGIWD